MSNKRTLVIGASPNASRYSHRAALELSYYKHPIHLLGLRTGEIAGVPIDTFPEPYGDIDTITLYLNSTNQRAYYKYILSLKPKRVIFNPGAENEELTSLLIKHDIEPLNACTLVMLSIGNY